MRTFRPTVSLLLLLLLVSPAQGRGVTPYLPLNLEPEIERQIERVLILAGKPVMTRPIAAATVLDALPAACRVDHNLCEQVARYLERYTRSSAVTHASIELAATSGADTTLPDRYGLHDRSVWGVSAQAQLQPSDFLLINLGGTAYDGEQNPTGSFVSVGFDWAQLDVGFRPHWFSPLTDSSMLVSSEAPTMPSVTLSNYRLLTRLGLQYELFAARMSNSDRIEYKGGFTSGRPRLAGIRLSMEPVSGWSFGVNRLMQYGGGARDRSGLRDLLDAYFKPSNYDNTVAGGLDSQFGNQVASVTSSLMVPGRTPFAVYAEYAGEDTSRGKNYLLGNSSLSIGVHFPLLWERFDLTIETTEWQNAWYVHEIYGDGLTNRGLVIGNWFGDDRVFNDAVGGRSAMAQLAWDATFGGQLQLRWRTLQNESYSAYAPLYRRASELTLAYSRPWSEYIVGGELDTGKDVFGASFARLAGFLRLNPQGGGFATTLADSRSGDSSATDKQSAEWFVSAGTNIDKVRVDLQTIATRTTTPRETSAHAAIGVRRVATERSDVGARLEFDDIEGHSLIGFRLIDYRYRFDGPLAIGVFLGAARYGLATPAYGFYYGAGVQWRNVLPGWDVGAEFRYADSVARDHLLPSDPVNIPPRNDSFYDIVMGTFAVTYHF